MTIHGLPFSSTTSKTVATAGVVQPGGGLGLAKGSLVDDVGMVRRDHRGNPDFLDGDVTLEQFVPATPDDAHGAAADRAVQAVPSRDPAAGSRHTVHGPGPYSRRQRDSCELDVNSATSPCVVNKSLDAHTSALLRFALRRMGRWR
jgi:hypothetical protein